MPMDVSGFPPRYQQQIAAQIGNRAPAPAKPGAVAAVAKPSASTKPLLKQRRGQPSKTELAFELKLRADYPGALIKAQGLTLPIANGTRYTPDFIVSPAADGVHCVIAFEVKGARIWDGSLEKLKIAAAQFPWIKFMLAVRKSHTAPWRIEEVLP